MLMFSILTPNDPSPPALLGELFHFDQAWAGLDHFRQQLGTAVSGTLGTMLLCFLVLSLAWGWVKNRFDTATMWDTFLRVAIVAAGITLWDTTFHQINDALDWLALGAGNINPFWDFWRLVYQPFLALHINGMAWGDPTSAGVDIALILIAAVQGWLSMLTVAVFSVSIIAQQFVTMLLYAIGPLFLVCYIWEPVQDLWMRWVRFFLTIKCWALVMNFTLFIYANATASIQNDIASCDSWILPGIYLILMIVSLSASLPIARALIGGAGATFFNGSSVTTAAVTAGGAALAVGGMAVGAAAGAGPAGAMAGGAAGAGAGSTVKSAMPKG